MSFVNRHVPYQIGTRDDEGWRTHAIPGDVCLGCSNPCAGRWVPVSQCPAALAKLNADDADFDRWQEETRREVYLRSREP